MNSEVHRTLRKIKVLPSTYFKPISYRFHQVPLVLAPQDLVEKIELNQYLHDFVYLDHMLRQTSTPNQGAANFLLSPKAAALSLSDFVFSVASPTPLSRCRSQSYMQPPGYAPACYRGSKRCPLLCYYLPC